MLCLVHLPGQDSLEAASGSGKSTISVFTNSTYPVFHRSTSDSVNMPPFLYTASIPVLLRYLDRLAELVDIAERHTEMHHLAAREVLDARLSQDMYSFESQVQIAANFALRASYPLAGKPVPDYGEFPASFAGLRSRISRNASLVRELQCSDFENAASRALQDVAGQAVVSLPAPEFLLQYALPNFFFHISVAYAILRKSGIAVGKQDFDGFHSYPCGI